MVFREIESTDRDLLKLTTPVTILKLYKRISILHVYDEFEYQYEKTSKRKQF